MLFTVSLLGACSDGTTGTAASTTPAVSPDNVTAQHPEDTIALVGDQVITFNQLNIMLNSSAMVGLSIPALGTPERNQTIITLLDKVISANLWYLDALDSGTDRQEPYVTNLLNFENAVLARMYRSDVSIGDISVSDEEIEAFHKTNIVSGTELTDDVRLAIESKLRKQKIDEGKASVGERLREGVKITIEKGIEDSANDSGRSDDDVIATAGDVKIRWGEVKTMMHGADQRAAVASFYVEAEEERMERLQRYIDNAIMASKARAAGMDKSQEFAERTREYRKTQLINAHRAKVRQGWMPSDDELQDYYLDNIDSIVFPESRKVQMVVLETKEEAESIKQKVDSGELSVYQAARDYSIDPTAKSTLGEMGWVTKGTGFKELDDFTFSLEPDVLGGPVESPAGWHLVKVLDVLDARYENLDDESTHRRTLRKYMKEKSSAYVVDLRKNRYEVVVLDDELARHFQQEADLIAELTKKAKEEGSVTEQRTEELEKWIIKPPQE